MDAAAVAVPDRHEFAGLVHVVDLGVAERGEIARTPVDDALGAVDQVVVVERFEDRLDGPRQAVVHREAFARPVDAVAETAHLAEDLPAVALLPLPRLRDEVLAGVVEASLALCLGQVSLDQRVNGNARVVHAG